MNNRRQTIWLVSMLSLMVILSAYYLFTEDTKPAKDAAGGVHQTHEDPGVQVEIVELGTAAAGTSGDATNPDEEAVLKRMNQLSGNDMITELQRQKMEKISSESERLSAIVADTKNYSQEEAAAAMEEMARLEDMDERMTSLEEKLLQEFDNAVVTEEKAHFQVVVQTPKLEKSQAVKILEMAAKELNVTPDRLSVKYVQ